MKNAVGIAQRDESWRVFESEIRELVIEILALSFKLDNKIIKYTGKGFFVGGTDHPCIDGSEFSLYDHRITLRSLFSWKFNDSGCPNHKFRVLTYKGGHKKHIEWEITYLNPNRIKTLPDMKCLLIKERNRLKEETVTIAQVIETSMEV